MGQEIIECEIDACEDCIEICVYDWNNEYWASYIRVDEYNIDEVCEFINELNWRDGDYEIQLIQDHGDTGGLYDFLRGQENEVLNPAVWSIWSKCGDDHIAVYNDVIGDADIDGLRTFEYSSYNDVYDLMDCMFPDLYRVLRDNCMMHLFDTDGFMAELDDVAVVSDGNIVSYWFE